VQRIVFCQRLITVEHVSTHIVTYGFTSQLDYSKCLHMMMTNSEKSSVGIFISVFFTYVIITISMSFLASGELNVCRKLLKFLQNRDY